MAMNVKFLQGSSTNFNKITTKEANTFYYITDKKALYLGANLIGDGVSMEAFNALAGRVQTLEDWREILKVGASGTSKVEGAAIPNLVDVTVNTKDGAVSGVSVDDSALRSLINSYVTTVTFNTYKDGQDARDDGQDSKIAALEETVEGIVNVGGEANLVDDVQINGTTIVAGKVANIVVDGAYSPTNKIPTMSSLASAVGGAVTTAKNYTNEEITGLEFALSKDGKTLELKNKAGTAVATLDTSDFVVDGMLSSVVADQANNKLTFTWNTDSGVQETVVELSSIADIYKGSTGEHITVAISNENVISATLSDAVKIAIGKANNAIQNLGAYVENSTNGVDITTMGPLDSKTQFKMGSVGGDITLKSGSGDILLETATGKSVKVNGVALGDLATKNEADLDLSSKQDKLSEVQLAAVNSGITAAKVGIYDQWQQIVSNNKLTWDKAGTAVQPAAISDMLTKTEAANTYQVAGNYEAAGAAAAVQGGTTNTVKDCVDAINALNAGNAQTNKDINAISTSVSDVVSQLTWGSF
jgi:hypothetical protein